MHNEAKNKTVKL